MILKRMLFEGRFTRPDLICGSSHPGEFIVPSTRRPAAKAGLLEERRLDIVVRRRGIKREKDSDSIAKLFAANLRRAEESVLGGVLVELTILLIAARQQTAQVLNEAAALYKVDTDAIAAKVKQEFAAKEKAKAAKKPAPKPSSKAAKESIAA